MSDPTDFNSVAVGDDEIVPTYLSYVDEKRALLDEMRAALTPIARRVFSLLHSHGTSNGEPVNEKDLDFQAMENVIAMTHYVGADWLDDPGMMRQFHKRHDETTPASRQIVKVIEDLRETWKVEGIRVDMNDMDNPTHLYMRFQMPELYAKLQQALPFWTESEIQYGWDFTSDDGSDPAEWGFLILLDLPDMRTAVAIIKEHMRDHNVDYKLMCMSQGAV